MLRSIRSAKQWITSHLSVPFYVTALVLGGVALWFTYNFAIHYSAIATFILMAVITMLLFDAFDRTVLRELDTINQLKQGNVAVALYYMAWAVLILGVLMFI